MRAVQSRVGCRRRTDRWGFIAKSFVFVVGLCGRRAAAGWSTAAVGVCHCPGCCAGLGWWRPKACGSATFATSSRPIFFEAERWGVAGEEGDEHAQQCPLRLATKPGKNRGGRYGQRNHRRRLGRPMRFALAVASGFRGCRYRCRVLTTTTKLGLLR